MAERIVATCMDRRLPQKIGAIADGIHVSNAGCNIAVMRDTLVALARQDKEIREIVAYVHTDCGAMGAVDDARNGHVHKYGGRIKHTLLDVFMGRSWKGRDDLERRENVGVQLKALEEIPALVGREIAVRVELIETSAIKVPEIDHSEFALLILKPSESSVPEAISKAGLKQFATYVVQLLNVSEALGDIELTINNLHVGRVVLGVAASSKAQTLSDKQTLKSAFPNLEPEEAYVE